MKRENNRHADEFNCDFTIEFCVKNPNIPDSVDEDTMRFESETGAFTNRYGKKCFDEITRNGRSYPWIKDWSFAGRMNGWFALICNGDEADVKETVMSRIEEIVQKYYREYGEKLEAFYNQRHAEDGKHGERSENQIPVSTEKNFETLTKAFKNGDVCLMRARETEHPDNYVTLICAMKRDNGMVEMIPFAMMLAEDGNPYDQFIPAMDDEFDEPKQSDMKKSELPTAEDLGNHGNEIDRYPVDESQTASNAGDAVLYEMNGRKFEVITWNDNAEDHEPGETTVNEITEE